jgi:raffinose/stachyose/melibiose transport system permease protein
MRLQKNKRNSIGLISFGFLALYSLISFFPLLFTIFSSFKTDQEIFASPFGLPTSLSFDNYIRAWTVSQLPRYFLNSVFLAVSACILLVLLGSSAAYALSKFQFRFKNVLYLYFIMGLMIPAQSTIIPIAYDVGKLGIRDSLLLVVLIISAFQLPITLLIFSGFMSTIPAELEEAAIIDGCTIFRVYTRIILPLSTPAIVTVTILNFLVAWNNILFPLVFLNDDSVKPIAIGLLGFFASRQSDYSGMMAAIVMTCMVPALVYILAQDKVEKGLTAGAVKG